MCRSEMEENPGALHGDVGSHGGQVARSERRWGCKRDAWQTGWMQNDQISPFARGKVNTFKKSLRQEKQTLLTQSHIDLVAIALGVQPPPLSLPHCIPHPLEIGLAEKGGGSGGVSNVDVGSLFCKSRLPCAGEGSREKSQRVSNAAESW